MKKVFVYDPTTSDKQSAVRGIGRYLQILKENFPEWSFVDKLTMKQINNETIFINPFFNFLQPPLTFRRLAKKQIAVIHDLIPLKYPFHFPAGVFGNINIFLNKLALKNYDLIITDSEASKKDIIDILRIEEKKIKVIYPCLPKLFLNSPPVISSEARNLAKRNLSSLSSLDFSVVSLLRNDMGEKFCLYVGDATWNKNLVNIARAIKIADVNCVFVGKVFGQVAKVASEETLREADCRDNRQSLAEEECHERLNLAHPWQKELKEFFELAKDDKRFIFTGFVPDFELIKLYQQASFNILPSRDEGFGFSYVESSQFGCPSLLSDIPTLREISDGNALFADPNNSQDIAEKIKEIYSDRILRNKIELSVKKRSEFFSPEKFKREFLSVI